jgi:hypothetical protein
MSLYSSIKEIQKNIEKSYLDIKQRFSGNTAIRDLWSKMARDVSQQIDSLQELPRSFWIHMKKDQEALLKYIKTEVKLQNFDNENLSLSECIENAIRSEEAVILKIYVPLIRNLRKNWSGRELDFYIMVKAHIVRFRRIAESFAGDPTVLKQAALMLQKFEKEVQEPEVDIRQLLKPSRKARTARGKVSTITRKSKQEKAVKPKTKAAKSKTVKPKVKVASSKTKAAKPKPKTAKSESKAKTSRKQNQQAAHRPIKRSSPSKPSANKPASRRKRARR